MVNATNAAGRPINRGAETRQILKIDPRPAPREARRRRAKREKRDPRNAVSRFVAGDDEKI